MGNKKRAGYPSDGAMRARRSAISRNAAARKLKPEAPAHYAYSNLAGMTVDASESVDFKSGSEGKVQALQRDLPAGYPTKHRNLLIV
jgi:hypothetical protein